MPNRTAIRRIVVTGARRSIEREEAMACLQGIVLAGEIVEHQNWNATPMSGPFMFMLSMVPLDSNW